MSLVRKVYESPYFKALDDSTGEFEAIVAVYGNVDKQGDRSMPGMFDKSLENYRSKGDPLSVIWQHDWADPFSHIGYADPKDVREILADEAKAYGDGITGGLYVKGHLDIDKPVARQVYDLLKSRRVREWSFAYDTKDESRAKDGANELNEVEIFECGPCLVGANSATTTLGVKSLIETAAEDERRLKKITWALKADEDTGMKLLKDWVTDTDPEKNASNQSGGSWDEPADLKWDGGAAMASAHSAADFRKIAFERDNDSDPDTAAHWALPHHPSPGAAADPAGVSAALGALNGARGGAPDLKDSAAARSHLEAHAGAEKSTKADVPGTEAGLRSHLVADHGQLADLLIDVLQARLDAAHSRLHGASGAGHTHEDMPSIGDPADAGKWFDEVYEKAEFKPWHVEKRGDEYCVIKDSDGSTAGCHPTREAALVHIRALYAAEGLASDESDDEKSAELAEVAAEAFDYGEKAGRALSAEREQAIRAAIDALTAILPVEGDEVDVAEAEKSAESERARAELEEYRRKLDLLNM